MLLISLYLQGTQRKIIAFQMQFQKRTIQRLIDVRQVPKLKSQTKEKRACNILSSYPSSKLLYSHQIKLPSFYSWCLYVTRKEIFSFYILILQQKNNVSNLFLSFLYKIYKIAIRTRIIYFLKCMSSYIAPSMFPVCTAVYTMSCLIRKTFKSFVKLRCPKYLKK